jgi:Kef-type K+ transport system membrane component KefB
LVRLLTQLAALVALMWFVPLLAGGAETHWAIHTLVLGFAILAAQTLSMLLRPLGVPLVTARLLLGLLAGPHLFALISQEAVVRLGLINDIALALIALTAGGELVMREIRPLLRTVLSMSIAQTLLVFGFVLGAYFLTVPHIPFLEGLSSREVLIIGVFIAGLAVTQSPAVTVAIISENRAAGRFCSTVLANVVLVDVLVIILFAALFAVSQATLDPAAPPVLGKVGGIVLGLAGSVAAGVGVAALLAAVMNVAGRRMPVLVMGATLVIAAAARPLGLDPPIVCLAAGFGVRNFTSRGQELMGGIESVSPLIYAIFFTMAGASLDLRALLDLWPVVCVLALVRSGAVFGATRAGAALAGADPTVQRHAWTAFISQAGVTLGLASLIASQFPAWGAGFRTLMIAFIGIHELIGPPLFKFGLARAGEINGQSEISPDESLPRPAVESPPAPARSSG